MTRILVAFMRAPSWAQAALARTCGVSAKTLRKHLLELSESGVPLEREVDWPHVYWSVPRAWFPGGAVLEAADGATAARLLARLPKSREREQVLSRLLHALGDVGTPARNDRQDPSSPGVLEVIEDAAVKRAAARIRYFSASRGDRSWRHISVQRIVYGEYVRLLATCHRSGTLKWFRLDSIEQAALDDLEPFRAVDPESIEEHLATSFGGYRAPQPPLRCAVLVRAPEARWVTRNLPEPMCVEHLADAVRLTVTTAGVEALARFVVGLGDAAQAETPELRERVLALAQGALRRNAAVRKLNRGAVGSNRAAG